MRALLRILLVFAPPFLMTQALLSPFIGDRALSSPRSLSDRVWS